MLPADLGLNTTILFSSWPLLFGSLTVVVPIGPLLLYLFNSAMLPARKTLESAPAPAVGISPKRRLIILACVASAIGVNAFKAIEPFYTVEALARNPEGGPVYHAVVGGVYSAYQVAGIASTPFIIWDLPNVGSKLMMVISLGTEGGAHVIFALLGRIANWKVFLAYSYCIRIIEGAAFLGIHIASMSVLVKLYPTRLGFVNGFQLTSLAVGHGAAELVVGGLYDVGGFKTPFLVTGSMMLIVTVGLAAFMVDIDKTVVAGDVDGDTKEKHVSVFAILRVPWVLLTLFMMLLVNLAYSAASALLAVQMKKEFGSSATIFSTAFSTQIAINAIVAPLVGLLLDRGWRARPMIVVGTALMGLGCLLVGPADFLHLPHALWLVFVSMVAWGVGRIMTVAAGTCFIYHHCESIGLGTVVELRVATAGLTRTDLSTGFAIGPIILSPMVVIWGFKKTFMLLGFVYFAMAALVAVIVFLSKAKESVQTSCQRVPEEGEEEDEGLDLELQPLKP